MHYTVAFEKYDYEGRVGKKKKKICGMKFWSSQALLKLRESKKF